MKTATPGLYDCISTNPWAPLTHLSLCLTWSPSPARLFKEPFFFFFSPLIPPALRLLSIITGHDHAAPLQSCGSASPHLWLGCSLSETPSILTCWIPLPAFLSGTGWELGPSAAVPQWLHLNTPLLEQQNTKKDCMRLKMTVKVRLGQLLDKSYRETKIPNCHFGRTWSKSGVLHRPPAHTTT